MLSTDKEKKDALKRQRSSRAAHRGVATTYINEIKTYLDEPLESASERAELERLRGKIERKLADITSKNAIIEELVVTNDLDGELKSTEANLVTIQDSLFEIANHLEAYDSANRVAPVAAVAAGNSSSSSYTSGAVNHLKLPKLELPVFTGNYTD